MSIVRGSLRSETVISSNCLYRFRSRFFSSIRSPQLHTCTFHIEMNGCCCPTADTHWHTDPEPAVAAEIFTASPRRFTPRDIKSLQGACPKNIPDRFTLEISADTFDGHSDQSSKICVYKLIFVELLYFIDNKIGIPLPKISYKPWCIYVNVIIYICWGR